MPKLNTVMNNVGGAVILYQPDKEIVRNILSYVSQLEFLIVLDNSNSKNHKLQEAIKSISDKVLFIDNPSNLGIAKCLNKAAQLALERKVDWLLTMDQDSFFEYDSFAKYIVKLEDACNVYSKLSILTLEHSKKSISNNTKPLEIVRSAITSGSIIKLEYWKQLGGFEEKLFIDEVDTEYVFKNLVANLDVVKCNNLFLNHDLGTTIQTGYFGSISKSGRIIHSPIRIYFMVRNYLYLNKKYAELLPLDVSIRRRNVLTSIKNNLLFSGNFFLVLKNIFNGYKDFLCDNYS
jgi:rhamnosyltransferase